MRNNELLPYDTIVQATSGEPEAVNTVLQYYGRRIRYASRISAAKSIEDALLRMARGNYVDHVIMQLSVKFKKK